VPAETPLVSTRTRPADTARKRTPSAVTEDPGPVLPSEREAGATAVCAEATRPVESAGVLTSPQSRAGMPAAVGEEPGRLERPAVPKEPGAHQRVPWTAASSETQPGERTWLVQTVSEPLRSKGREHAQEVPVEKPDRERVVPGAAQVQADPPSIAARGCRGREKPQAARPAKPAEPPDRLRRSPAYSRAKAS
jgi:hypothetical protein